MVVYLSGPMSGIIDKNKKAFMVAHNEVATAFRTIKTEKLRIINPVRIGAKVEKQFALLEKEPKWEDYMRACIKQLSEAQIIYMLPNWGNSDGAVLEKHIANRLQIPSAENFQELIKIIVNNYKTA